MIGMRATHYLFVLQIIKYRKLIVDDTICNS